MVVLNRRQVQQLLHERRQAMADTRFRPENFHEIHRVLGVRFAPDLTRVVTKQRASVASAYLKRLQRDVERSHGGFYNQLQALPLQIRRMKIHTEDTRSFKSVLVPRMKLPTVGENDTPPALSPKTFSPKSVSPGADLPPLVLPSGSNFVAHKSFSPHTNTHIHVLYKQGPGSVTPRKGAMSVASTSPSVQGAQSVADPKSRRSSVQFQAPVKPSPREEARPKVIEDSESESGSSVQDSPQPYSYIKMAKEQAPLPHIKKHIVVNLMPRADPHKASLDQHLHQLQQPQPQVDQPGQWTPTSRVLRRRPSHAIPPKVASALAAGGNPATAVYKFVLPSTLGASYNTSSSVERPKALVMGSRSRVPLPSISSKPPAGTALAVTSVRPSLVHAAA